METSEANLQPWGKRKLTAVLVAVFLGPWTWLYTYQKSAWKLSLGLGITSSIWAFMALIMIESRRRSYPPGYDAIPPEVFLLPVLAIITFAAWIWSIVDSAVKRSSWYELRPTGERTWGMAFALAFVTGPWAWLYTYPKSKWKWWSALTIGYVLPIFIVAVDAFHLSGSDVFGAVSFLTASGIWLAAVLDSALKSDSWYRSFGKQT